jgi:hypothetical protein
MSSASVESAPFADGVDVAGIGNAAVVDATVATVGTGVGAGGEAQAKAGNNIIAATRKTIFIVPSFLFPGYFEKGQESVEATLYLIFRFVRCSSGGLEIDFRPPPEGVWQHRGPLS